MRFASMVSCNDRRFRSCVRARAYRVRADDSFILSSLADSAMVNPSQLMSITNSLLFASNMRRAV